MFLGWGGACFSDGGGRFGRIFGGSGMDELEANRIVLRG